MHVARFLATLLATGMPVMASAATISGVAAFLLPGFSTGSLGPVGATPAPNNDNAGGPSPNVISYSVFQNSSGVIEAEYLLGTSGGTTEYRIAQTLVNNSGQAWTGYRYELGFGTGAGFVRSTAGDQFDFDAPERDPAPTSTQFASLVAGLDTLVWSGGTVPSIGVLVQTFAIDVPDGLTRFTLRQAPIVAQAAVPEPSSLLLLVGGLGAFGAARRRARVYRAA